MVASSIESDAKLADMHDGPLPSAAHPRVADRAMPRATWKVQGSMTGSQPMRPLLNISAASDTCANKIQP